jgi:hypothetical protein
MPMIKQFSENGPVAFLNLVVERLSGALRDEDYVIFALPLRVVVSR